MAGLVLLSSLNSRSLLSNNRNRLNLLSEKVSRSWPTRPLQYHHHLDSYRECGPWRRPVPGTTQRLNSELCTRSQRHQPGRTPSTTLPQRSTPWYGRWQPRSRMLLLRQRTDGGTGPPSKVDTAKVRSPRAPPTSGVRRRNIAARSRHRGRCTAVGMCVSIYQILVCTYRGLERTRARWHLYLN